MTRTNLLICLLLLLYACRKSDNTITPPVYTNTIIALENEKLAAALTKQTTDAWLNGFVTDELGSPVANALVTCGSQSAITDKTGFYAFRQKTAVNNDYATIKITQAGYINGFKTFTVAGNKVTVHTENCMLLKADRRFTVPAGGGIVTADSMQFNFPADAISNSNGNLYTGSFTMQVRYINPAAGKLSLACPGILNGLNSAGQFKAIETMGIAFVELQDAVGNKLEIAKGKTVTMQMPAPADGPATLPLWHFNEMYGLWIQQGTAEKQGNWYVASVNHFSDWNIGMEINTSKLVLNFRDGNARPVSGLRVEVYNHKNWYYATIYPDNNGEATLLNCAASGNMQLRLAYPCDTLAFSILPVTADRTETIVMDNVLVHPFRFTGKISGCNNTALPNQPFHLFLTGTESLVVLSGISDAQGLINAETAIPSCMSDNVTVQSSVYTNGSTYFSAVTSISAGDNNYDVSFCPGSTTGISYNDSDIVTIPDPVLQQLVRTKINKPSGSIYYTDVRGLKNLSGFFLPPVQTLEGLQYFTGLDTLEIDQDTIQAITFSDASPLKNLVNLRYLALARSNVSDLEPFRNLAALETLYLQGTKVTNLSPLTQLNNLRELWASSLSLTDVSPLAEMTNLTNVQVGGQALTDISSLKTLSHLQFLGIAGSPVADISVCQNLKSLISLSAYGCKIADISSLDNLTKLQVTYLGRNQITDISVLKTLPALIVCDLDHNQVTTLPDLSAVKINFLDLSYNNITTIDFPAAELPMHILYLNNNHITNISGLRQFTKMEALLLTDNAITDLTPIRSMQRLQNLNVRNNGLQTIQPLINYNHNMRNLHVGEGNSIPDVELVQFKTTHPDCVVD